MALDSTTYTVNTFELVGPNGERLQATAVNPLASNRYELTFQHNFTPGDSGTWQAVSTGQGPQDLSGNRLPPGLTSSGGQLSVVIEPLTLTNRITASLSELAPVYTQTQDGHPRIVLEVFFYSPLNPANTAAMVSRIAKAIKLVNRADGAELYAEFSDGAALSPSNIVAAYYFPRNFAPGQWDVIAAQRAMTDGFNTLPLDATLGQINLIQYVPGPEQWHTSNPPNPVYPREAPLSSRDLTGRWLAASGVTVRNFFDLGVDADLNWFEEPEKVKTIELSEDGTLCITFEAGHEQANFNFRAEHYAQLLTGTVEIEVTLTKPVGFLALVVNSHTGGLVPVAVDETDLQGVVRLTEEPNSTTISWSSGTQGTAKITTSNLAILSALGNIDTRDGEAQLCLKLSSDTKFYDIRVVPNGQLSQVVPNESTSLVAQGTNYYDAAFLVYAGEVVSWDIKIDGFSAPQNGTFFNNGQVSISYGFVQQLGSFTRYSARFYDLVAGAIVGPYTIETHVELATGQVFEHRYTVVVAPVRAPGIYGLTDGQELTTGETATFTIGNPDPARSITSVQVTHPTGGATYSGEYGANIAATVTFSFEAQSPGDYPVSVQYTYADGTETVALTATVPAPPPIEPDPGFLMVSYQDVPVGGQQILSWNISPNRNTRARESVELVAEGATYDLGVVGTGGSQSHTVESVGAKTATLKLKFTDWPVAIETAVNWNAIEAPAPDNVSARIVNGALRVQWREPQVKTSGVKAESYTIYLNNAPQAIAAADVTEHADATGYRYTDITIPTETTFIKVSATWAGTESSHSSPTTWVTFDERNLRQITADAPLDLVVAKEAIDLGPQAANKAANTASAAYRNAIVTNPLNSVEVLANTFLREFNRDTHDAWATIEQETDNPNLKSAAKQNREFFVQTIGGDTIGASIAATDCVTGSQGACEAFYDMWAAYLRYLNYAANQTADALMGIRDWAEAGEPA